MYGRRSGIVKHLHARQALALEQLERRAATGRQVVDPIGHPELLQRSAGVAAAYDGRTGRVRDGFCHSARSCRERLHLERAHWTVPEDRPGSFNLSRIGLDGLRSDIEAHPAVRDIHAVEVAYLRIRGEAVTGDDVERQQDPAVRGLRLLERFARELDPLLLDERISRLTPLRAKEAERHRAADQQRIRHVEKAVYEGDLVGNLRSA